MLREIRDLGFEYAELSHGIRISLLPGILTAVDAGEIKISTLHNFCPLPIGINHAAPNIFKFTAADARERDNAWRHSLKTIETAARRNAVASRARRIGGLARRPGPVTRAAAGVARGAHGGPAGRCPMGAGGAAVSGRAAVERRIRPLKAGGVHRPRSGGKLPLKSIAAL